MTARSTRFRAALAAVAVFGAAPAAAQDKGDDGPPPGLFSIQVENDLFGGGTDRHYTQGMRAMWLPSPDFVPDAARKGALLFPGVDESDTFTFVFALGQNMYTPEDISRPVPDPNDRPYAGWLYFSIGAVAEDSQRNILHNLELDLGVVGPWSLAGKTQRWWHEIINSPEPKGWGYQLDNEPGVVLTYEARLRTPLVSDVAGLSIDATPKAGFALGNVFTYGGLGGTVRFGHNLDIDYGPPLIRPSLPGAGLPKKRDEWGWYLFAGVEGRAVARNIFLDGNTFSAGPSVDKKILTGDIQLGAVVSFGNIRLSLTEIIRTEEFKGQNDPDQFGSISLTVLY